MKGAPKKYLLEDYQLEDKKFFERYNTMKEYVKEIFNKILPKEEDDILLVNTLTKKKIALARVVYHPKQIDI